MILRNYYIKRVIQSTDNELQDFLHVPYTNLQCLTELRETRHTDVLKLCKK